MSRNSTRRVLVTLAVALALALIPVGVLAAGGAFTDDDTSIFETDIEWLAGAGVTKGCNPPANDRFCPEDNVSRGQMSAFMRRFAQYLGAEDGQVSRADEADSATNAANADQLAGQDATAFDTFIVADAEGNPEFLPYVTLPKDADANLAEVAFTAPAAGAMTITGTVNFQHESAVENYVEPLFNSASFTGSVALSPGAHSLTLCGRDLGGGDDIGVISAAITGVVSPSDNSVIGATETSVILGEVNADSR